MVVVVLLEWWPFGTPGPPFLLLEILTTVTSSSPSVSDDKQSSCRSGAVSPSCPSCCCCNPDGPGLGLKGLDKEEVDEGPGCGSSGGSLLTVASAVTSALTFAALSIPDSSLTCRGVPLELELDLALAADEVDGVLLASLSTKASWFTSFFAGTDTEGVLSWGDSFWNGLFLPD